VVIPRAYILIIFSSTSEVLVSYLGRILGSNSAFLSLGISISALPAVVKTFFL
jgi:hypothetical protein